MAKATNIGKFLGYDKLVFFDCETTGLDPEKDQITELAAVVVYDDRRSVRMDLFIQLPEGETLKPEIVELTGITDQMLREKGITEEIAMRSFMELLVGNTLLIAHNAQFDLNFVYEALKRNKEINAMPFFDADYMDTLTVFKDRRPYPHRLENAIEKYKLQNVENSHRAIDDVLALAAVYDAMFIEKADCRLREYINLFGFNPKYDVFGTHFLKVIYAPQKYEKSQKWPLPFYQALPYKVRRAQQKKEGTA